MPTRRPIGTQRAQRGSFLLEALISVLIVALGLLGLIGLQARAIQNVDDAQYRAEAAYLANALLGQMWVHDPKTAQLKADFDDSAGGPNYTEFKTWVAQRLPGGNVFAPKVSVTAGLTPQASDVHIQIFWQPPSEAASPLGPHKYEIVATVAGNP